MLRGKCWGGFSNQGTTTSTYLLFISLFTSHPTPRRYVVQAADSVVVYD
jgi:hypothetical protein